MKTEYTINPHTGEMVVRRADEALLTPLQTYLGPSEDAECGQSHQSQMLSHYSQSTQVRIAAVVHGSLVDGPGLRSVAFMQGCPSGCSQSSHTHSFGGGIGTTVSALTSELVRSDVVRDGVTLSGGEPLAQPEACAQIVKHLKDEPIARLSFERKSER
ncbi:MAG: radical SAM protein [Chloroflexi bacterium]|nr:radical SAM protein [Chloroflexota bacterium]MDA8186974.1 4Fe-4S cluster-binding domain-containing protein [Dehalococcoidales bacterium]